jgi:hypothetical protein
VLKRVFALTLAVLCAHTATVHAQYFGRNTIQYDRFRFSILQTEHFDVYYYDSEREAAQIAARLAERWYAKLSALFDHQFARRQPVILYASHGHFTQTDIVAGLSEGVGGFTDHAAGRVVLPFSTSLGETDHVLGHELVHAFQRDILRRHGKALSATPLWFAEGMAEQISVGGLDANTRMWLRDAAAHGGLPTLAQLADPRWFPYRYGQALWSYLETEHGSDVYRRVMVSRASSNVLGQIEAVTGRSRRQLDRAWRAWMRALPSPPGTVMEPEGTILVARERNGGRLNVSPALSPDARYLVFFSERDDQAMDVYLADGASGEVLKRLTSTSIDAHVDSLQYLDSTGAWSNAGNRFALATVRDGRPVVMLFDMPSGAVVDEITIPDVDRVIGPTFSPDGARLAFSATHGGFSDLYVFNLKTRVLRPLTTDAYADLQPSWSPTGERIAFVTDRFSSSVDDLTFGHYGLATIDLASRDMHALGGLPDGKNIDPRWDASGKILYFVSDGDGASNVYRFDASTGAVSPVSSIATGVSGVTAMSPAITVAQNAGVLAMSVYHAGSIRIQRMSLAGVELQDYLAHAAPPEPAVAPLAAAKPAPRSAALFQTYEFPQTVGFTPKPYSPRLSLLSMGQPYLSAGGGAFGSFIRAGVSFSMSDMLGEQSLGTAIQVGRRVTDFALQTRYVNRRSRLNWGITGGQVPAIVGMSESVTRSSSATDQPQLVRRADVLHTIHRQLSTSVSYPFNRALRMDVEVGGDRVAFERESTTSAYSAATGALQREDRSRSLESSATLFASTVALVYDATIHGPVGPHLGQRYRVALSPSLGDINVFTAAADYRRYWMPVQPFTVAVRAQHVSRLGAGSRDPRLLPVVWTLRDLVRGYELTDELLRMQRYTAGNVELRAPIPGVFQRELHYWALPIEAFTFADWGLFGSSVGASSRNLWSGGAGARVNAAGFVFEFAAARTFAATSGWRMVVNFKPAF